MSRSPVVLVTGALIGIGRAIVIRYGRAWARAGSWRLLGDVGGGDSRVRANGQPDQHAGEQQHRGVRGDRSLYGCRTQHTRRAYGPVPPATYAAVPGN
jgi:NAD(P)-dependent dehydrogenase (short-subunit alcohol dehydrogenase family)